ncbi:hypothetical protein JCM5353_002783 [Sporobolomyces roseus]
MPSTPRSRPQRNSINGKLPRYGTPEQFHQLERAEREDRATFENEEQVLISSRTARNGLSIESDGLSDSQDDFQLPLESQGQTTDEGEGSLLDEEMSSYAPTSPNPPVKFPDSPRVEESLHTILEAQRLQRLQCLFAKIFVDKYLPHPSVSLPFNLFCRLPSSQRLIADQNPESDVINAGSWSLLKSFIQMESDSWVQHLERQVVDMYWRVRPPRPLNSLPSNPAFFRLAVTAVCCDIPDCTSEVFIGSVYEVLDHQAIAHSAEPLHLDLSHLPVLRASMPIDVAECMVQMIKLAGLGQGVTLSELDSALNGKEVSWSNPPGSSEAFGGSWREILSQIKALSDQGSIINRPTIKVDGVELD